MSNGLPCHGCGYRRAISGDEHSRCAFDWFKHDQAGLAGMFKWITAQTEKWFRFPFNYDPIWGPGSCAQRADTADPAKTAAPNPLADLLSLLR